MRRLIPLLIATLLVSACSRVYHKPPTDHMREAGYYFQTAKQWEAKQDWKMALQLYTLAWNKYVLANRTGYKFTVAVAIARQHRRLHDDDNYRQWLDTAQNLLDPRFPEREAALTLLLIETAMENQLYDDVLTMTEKLPAEPDPIRAELLAYRIQASVRKDLYPDTDIERLNRMTHRLDRDLKKGRLDDPSVLSFAWYSIGYALIGTGRPEGALDALKKAYKIDQTYELFPNLADDLFLLGHCHHMLFHHTEAAQCMNDARQIYHLLNREDRVNKVDETLLQWERP